MSEGGRVEGRGKRAARLALQSALNRYDAGRKDYFRADVNTAVKGLTELRLVVFDLMTAVHCLIEEGEG